MRNPTIQRQDRIRRSELAGFHTLQGRQRLEHILTRVKYRLKHPRFIEAQAK